MRYEDASGAFQASGPVANDDSDTLAAGARGPATGNLITGEGTQYGAAGADSAAGAHVTTIAGKGGEDASFAGGKLSVAGEFGQLSVDAEGNYSYLANKGAPENVRDRFTYTLADNEGNSDTAALIVEIGKTPVVIKADAQQMVPGPDGVVTLPPGVELSDIMVVGRNLVVNMPDGTQLIIVDGAVFVPQLVLGGVEIPATNVAALLIGQEPQPAAGETPPSSGGNFALPPPPLDPGVPLGDLLPPTEYNYRPPEPQETFIPVDEDPEILIQPDGQPASVAAVDQVEEAGLPERDGNELDEPAGSAESADGNGADNDVNSEATAGTIIISSPDGVGSVTINGVLVTGAVGQEIAGDFGTLTITGFDGDNILYSYLLHDNTSGNDTHDDFAVELTDTNGDVASATLRIDIIDDVPTARDDTDALGVGDFGPATGNVITDASAGDAGDSDSGADTVGADDATITSVTSNNVPGNVDTDAGANFQIAGQYGVLTLNVDGSYSYVRNEGSPGGVEDVFTYTLTDGDGDTDTATLTITIPDTPIVLTFGNAVSLDDDALPGGNPGGPEDDDPDTSNTVGDLNISGGDGALTFSLLTTGAPTGFTYIAGPDGSLLIQQGGVTVITVTLDAATGEYTVTQNAPIDHPSLDGQTGDNTENNVVFPVTVRVTDADGDTAEATGQIIVDDDSPIAVQAVVTGTVDEDGVPGGIAGGPGDVAGESNVANGSVASLFSVGADGPVSYNLLSDTSGLPALTSGGDAVTYEVNGNVLTASAGGATVFTFELNADGSWTFTLVGELDHPTLDGLAGDNTENDLSIALGSLIQATDADGDSVTANADGLVITVDDDTPTAQAIEANQASEDATIQVNIVGSIAGGADGVDLADVTFSAHNGSGTLSYNDNGLFTYDPAPGEEGDVSFTYTIVDGDGDEVTQEITIHLQPDSVPQVGTPENLEVDEDGFEFANDDASPLQSDPSETDQGENLTDSGNVVVDFGDDVPGAPLVDSIELLDSGALDGQLVDLDGNPVTFALNGSGQLVGTANGVTVMIISISGAVAGPGAGEVTYSYSAQLLQPVQHADVGNTENSDLLSGVQFQVTDSDGDTAGGSFSVTVWDDVPSASDIEVNQPAEDANVVIDITGSIVEGADGVDLADVTFSAHTGSGNLSYNDNGVFTYDPAPGEEGDVTFTYTIVDGDGDEVTKEVTIHLQPDSNPEVGTPENLLVDEDGLDGANVDADPLQGNPGETDSTESTTDTGSVVVDFGNDVPGAPLVDSIELLDSGALDGQLVDLDGNPVTFALNGSGQLVGTANGVTVMVVSITGAVAGPAAGQVTYSYSAELFQPVQHADAGNNENTDLLSGVQFQVTDSDGDVAGGSFNVTVVDDVPSATNDVDNITSGGDTATGNVITGEGTNAGTVNADTVGVDQPGQITAISGFGGTDTTFSGGVLEIAGEFGTLEIDADGNYTYTRAGDAPGSAQDVFTYTLTDADGDEVTATLTININDAAPDLPNPDLVQLDDDAVGSDGNPGGDGDDADSAGLPGQLSGTGGDGDLDYNFTGVNTLPAGLGFTVNPVDASTVEILQNGTVVLTISLNNEDGSFNVVQNNPIVHPVESTTEDNLVFQIGVEVEDADGDVEPATITINVDDDTPVIANVTAGAGVDVDETDAGSPAGFPISDTSADPVIDADLLFGADGAAAVNSVVYGLSIVGGSPEPSGLATAIGDHPITLVQIDGDTVEGQYEDGGTQVAFTIQMNADGTVTLTQEVPLEHLNDTDHNDTLDLDGLINATVTITDSDGDSTSDSAPIGDNLVFFDDGPSSEVNGQVAVPTLTLDETRPEGNDGDDGDNAPAGLASVTVGFAGNFLAADFGADGAGTTSYALVLAAEGAASGLYALDNTDTETVIDGYGQGAQILLFSEPDGSITGRTVDGGPVYFTISVDASGNVTFEQSLNVWHANTATDDDTSSLIAAAETLVLEQTVTDSDGDSDTATIDLSDGVFAIEDDGPEIIQATDAQGDNSGLTPTAEGIFDFDIGTDSPNGGNDDITVSNFTVTVNGAAVTNLVLTPAEGDPSPETATTASYSFSFTYANGPDTTANATGTLVFNKADGTYTVTLDSGPIEGFSIASVQGDADGATFYTGGVVVTGSGEVAVSELADDFFIQFTGREGVTTPASGFGNDDLWGGGVASDVKISSTAIGVHGNSVQDNDVLDYNFFSSDPGGTISNSPTASAGTAFIKITQFNPNGGEDFVVTLKLADPNDPANYITRTVVVETGDVLTTAPAGYAALGNGEGYIIFEPNDYINLSDVPDNYEIVGMQLRSSNEGTSSAAGETYNFEGALDAFDNSVHAFDTAGNTGTNDNDVFKIIDIGVIRTSTEDQSAEFNFDVTITDVDGDSETSSLVATIGDAPAITLAASTMETSSELADDGATFSNLSFSNDNGKWSGQGNDKGFSSVNTTGIVAGIVAASGLQSTAAAAQPSIETSFDVGLQDSVQAIGLPAYQLQSIDDGALNVQTFGLESSEPAFDFNALQGSNHSFSDFVDNGGLDIQSYGDAVPAYEPSLAVDQAPAFDASMLVAAVAPAVSMPSAEALIEAGLVNSQQGGSVEQILADALGGGAPTVDSLLDAINGGQGNAPVVDAQLGGLPGGGGGGDLSAVLNGASPDVGFVSGWDMHAPGSFGAGFDMMFKMDVAMLHQDAVQPAING